LIVSGGLHPDREPKEEAWRQLRLRTRNVSLLADSFANHAVVPVIDDVLAGRRFDEYAADLSTRPLRLIVLDPPLRVAERRDAARAEKQVFEIWRHLHAELVAAMRDRGLWLDTAEQTPAETVAAIVARFDETVAA
jgi:hypothetical protein